MTQEMVESMGQGTQFRANGEECQGLLTNAKYFASVGQE